MKVIVGTSLVFKIGGVRSHILTLHKALNNNGHMSSLVHLNDVNILDIVSAGIKALGNREKAYIEVAKARAKNAFKIAEGIINNGNCDLIHAHDVFLGSIASECGKPFVLTVHGPTSREAKMLKLSDKRFYSYIIEQERRAYKNASHIIAVDTTQKDIIVDDFNINPEKISVILNAVDVNSFTPDTELKTQNKPYFLVPRKLTPKNGVDIAIKAFASLKDQNYELWVAGDGPEMGTMSALIKEMGLSDKVKLLGLIDNNKISGLMNSAVGIIIPSVPVNGVVEASSIAALEGMSMRKPVIASNVGGLKEIITDGETGISFEAGNHQELASIIRKLAGDTERCKILGDNARRFVIDNYSTEVWIKKVEAVYKSVLQHGGH